MTRSGAVVLLLLASACVPGEGPMMRPFEDCLGCHGKGEGKAWTVAGTWARGARVSITDANGKNVPLRGNDAGNFYTAERLTFPLTVSVDGRVMPDSTNPAQPAKLAYGGCNACHRAETVTVGPLMAPGADCLGCHGATGMASTKFTAAGTFPPAGQTVVVGNQTATTNEVGNFYVTAPILFPTIARVGGQTMPQAITYGGCNLCHGGGGAGD